MFTCMYVFLSRTVAEFILCGFCPLAETKGFEEG